MESILVTIFKKKGNIYECGNYLGTKLLFQMMKCSERVLDERIRVTVEPKLGEKQERNGS